jgi:hypothetical protein
LFFLLNFHHTKKCFKQILCPIKDVCKLTSLLYKEQSVVYVWNSQIKDRVHDNVLRGWGHLTPQVVIIDA